MIKDPKKTQPDPQPNRPLHTEVKILKHVIASSTEAEIVGTFHYGKVCMNIRTCLEEAGHKQLGPTPVKTNKNENTDCFANCNVKRKLTKHMDTRQN